MLFQLDAENVFNKTMIEMIEIFEQTKISMA